jgi:target of EGR1 protein 1
MRSVEERYKFIAKSASDYAILSLGISCFSIETSSLVNSNVQIENRTFNILTFCLDDFMIEPQSIKFLSSHGFDFNQNFKNGIGYHKGNDNTETFTRKKQTNTSHYLIRSLIVKIAELKIPIVLHNGFIDLIFIYENFYAKCPESLMKFVADLSEIFSGGIYDTKYIGDFHAHANASFLEYSFHMRLIKIYFKIYSVLIIIFIFIKVSMKIR